METFTVPHRLGGTEEAYAFVLPQQARRVKGITAIVLNNNDGSPAKVDFSREENVNYLKLTINDNGTQTDVYVNQLADGRLMHLNPWITCDGYTTDAYILAFRHEKNTPANNNNIFFCYGSSLRKEGKTLFATLSKVTTAFKK